jgi:hypothetical protein
MRVKSRSTFVRLRRDALDTRSTAVAAPLPPLPRPLAVHKAWLPVAIVIATGCAMALSGVVTDLHGAAALSTNRANQASDASPDCSARYAGLLDLAELARREGKSSEVVVRGLTDRRGAMSECLPTIRREPAQP